MCSLRRTLGLAKPSALPRRTLSPPLPLHHQESHVICLNDQNALRDSASQRWEVAGTRVLAGHFLWGESGICVPKLAALYGDPVRRVPSGLPLLKFASDKRAGNLGKTQLRTCRRTR